MRLVLRDDNQQVVRLDGGQLQASATLMQIKK
jgi:hypothetical protein